MEPEGKRSQGGTLLGVSPVTIAAHELKSPLVLLRQLSLELAYEHDQKEQARIREQMVQVSEKALRLTSDITRAEALQYSMFDQHPVNPLMICDDVSQELLPLYRQHGRTIQVGRSRSLPPVIANRDLLRRILLNFADNALHYTDEEGVVELHAQLLRTRSFVRVSVRDYGPSVSIKQWKQLTTSLESAKQVHARPQSSGLGLHIAHQFAAAMNGRIGAIRHHDGASFYVELPVSHQMQLI